MLKIKKKSFSVTISEPRKVKLMALQSFKQFVQTEQKKSLICLKIKFLCLLRLFLTTFSIPFKILCISFINFQKIKKKI